MSSGRVLVFNAGSATLKSTVLDLPAHDPRADATVEWSSTTSPETVGEAIDAVIEDLAAEGIATDSIDVVGHRVVHGGEQFAEATRIDDDVLAALDGLSDLAPIHNSVATSTIRAARGRIARPHVAVFDTAFHATLPESGRRYPVPDEWTHAYGVRRFGFHGLSVAWSVRQAAAMLDTDAGSARLVVAHLGGGCSVTAVDKGRSIDTSMGLTPLEGLMMGSRAGSIDPGIVFHLMRSGVSADEIERTLDRGSGLRGIAGTDDMRRLLAMEGDGEPAAALAIDLFVRRAAAGIAAAATTLDGIDALVFTGGIGEHAAEIRWRVCARLGLLRVPTPEPDDASGDRIVAGGGDRPAVIVVHAREDVVIAEAALEVGRP